MDRDGVVTVVDFNDYIANLTKDFTGRDWVFERLCSWLQQPPSPRHFLIVGEPGSGKSAIAARIVQISRGEVSSPHNSPLGPGCLTFYHFCQANKMRTVDPLSFVERLSLQLAKRYPLFASALAEAVDIQTPQIHIESMESTGSLVGVQIQSLQFSHVSSRVAFDSTVRGPLEKVCTPDFNETILILVDALDEALIYSGEENLLDLLESATSLPPQVRFVLTSRPDPRVLEPIGQPALDLVAHAPTDVDRHISEDIYAYAFHKLAAVEGDAMHRSALASAVASASAGNFLYAHFKLDDLLRSPGPITVDSLELPADLHGLYSDLMRRLVQDAGRWHELYLPVLGALAVSRGGGLTLTQLVGITSLSESRVLDVLRSCAQILDAGAPDGPFRFYHESLREFLLSEFLLRAGTRYANAFYVFASEQHLAIARYYLRLLGIS